MEEAYSYLRTEAVVCHGGLGPGLYLCPTLDQYPFPCHLDLCQGNPDLDTHLSMANGKAHHTDSQGLNVSRSAPLQVPMPMPTLLEGLSLPQIELLQSEMYADLEVDGAVAYQASMTQPSLCVDLQHPRCLVQNCCWCCHDC